MSGIYLVTLPIGNMKDITLRALETLNSVKVIYAEDTRVFRSTAQKLDISLEGKRVDSFHDHSGSVKLDKILNKASIEDIAIVSDAGSPLVSDPAFPIIQKANELGVQIHSIAGINSVVTALELSALPPTPFHFHGFIARETSKKNELYEGISSIYGTHIFFEGVSRVEKTLAELSKSFPKKKIVVARELTKEFESVYRFLGEEFEEAKKEIVFKGEFVILVSNTEKQQQSNPKLKEMAIDIIEKGAKPKKIAKLLASITGESSKDIYEKINS